MKKAKIGEGAVNGPGMPLRQVLYISELAEISGGREIRTLDLATAMCNVGRLPIETVEKLGLLWAYWPCCTKKRARRNRLTP